MKDRISALMDGELDERGAAQAIEALCRDREARAVWGSYHLIGDAMRDCRLLSAGFAARVGERLSGEPAVLAPRRAAPEQRRWRALSVAASFAAVALVGWLFFAPQTTDEPVAVAKAPAAVPALAQPPSPAIMPLPSAADDYLLAHQGFSPRLDLQGMAPYVRTVSDSSQDAR